MRSTINRCSAAFDFILALAIPSVLSAHQSGQASGLDPTWVIKSNLNEVIVPVVVRDTRGVPDIQQW